MAWLERLPGHDDFVAGKESGDFQLAVNKQACNADRCSQPHFHRAKPDAGGKDLGPGSDVFAGTADILAHFGVFADGYGITFGPAVFLHHHRVTACRYRRPGEYPGGLAGFQRMPDCAGRDALSHPQPGGSANNVGDSHGITIHGTVVQWRNVDPRSQALGKHPPKRIGCVDQF